MLLIDLPVRQLLDRFSSADPTPGGGSASALASAVGASLLMMVAGLPKTKRGSQDDRAALAGAAAVLDAIRRQLTDAIDADAAAYNQVVAAYKLPKGSAGEQAARQTAIQRALRMATDVPLAVARLSADALAHAPIVAAHGHRAAASDVGVAVALLRAGMDGARLNVEINTGSLTDGDYAERVRSEIARASASGAHDAADAEALLLD